MTREWLAELRNKKELNHEQVAKLAEIERSTYTKVENGNSCSVTVAKKIGKTLGFNWTKIFDHVGDERSPNAHA